MTALVVSNVVLWVMVIVLAVVVLALVRQLGVLHERITPVGALMLARGPKVGERAPALVVNDLDGQAVTIGAAAGAAQGEAKSLLLLFVSPTCPVCKVLLPVLKASRKSEQAWLDIVLASDGELAEQREFVRAQGLEALRYVVSTPLGVTYQVSRLPYAVLIDGDGTLRARGIINSREHLESLFEAKRLGVASVQDYLEARARDQAA